MRVVGGRFEIEGEVGAGGMAVVHRARGLGRHEEAVAALRPIVAVLFEQSFKLESHEARQAFLGNVEENARVIALAREWAVATEPTAQ